MDQLKNERFDFSPYSEATPYEKALVDVLWRDMSTAYLHTEGLFRGCEVNWAWRYPAGSNTPTRAVFVTMFLAQEAAPDMPLVQRFIRDIPAFAPLTFDLDPLGYPGGKYFPAAHSIKAIFAIREDKEPIR